MSSTVLYMSMSLDGFIAGPNEPRQAHGFKPRIRHQIDDFPTVLSLVESGQGVPIVSRLAVANPPAGLTFTELEDVRRIRLANRRGIEEEPAVASLRAAIACRRDDGGARRDPGASGALRLLGFRTPTSFRANMCWWRTMRSPT